MRKVLVGVPVVVVVALAAGMAWGALTLLDIRSELEDTRAELADAQDRLDTVEQNLGDVVGVTGDTVATLDARISDLETEVQGFGFGDDLDSRITDLELELEDVRFCFNRRIDNLGFDFFGNFDTGFRCF